MFRLQLRLALIGPDCLAWFDCLRHVGSTSVRIMQRSLTDNLLDPVIFNIGCSTKTSGKAYRIPVAIPFALLIDRGRRLGTADRVQDA
jgi:hypothetical protein